MSRYNNYHKHTCYSNIRSLDCVSKPIEYINRAKELDGENAIYFSVEHGYQGNIYEAHTLCKNNNVKLIVGAEVYYVQNRLEKDKSNYHMIIIAKNKNGYKQLNKILSMANMDGFYYKPRIDDELLFGLNDEDFIITTACVAGRLREDGGLNEWLIKMKKYFKNNFYLEVQSHNHINQKKHNEKVLQLSNKYNIPIIHANDSHYINKEDAKYRDLFLKAKGIVYEEENGFILDYPTYDEIMKRYKEQNILSDEEIKSALENTLIFDSFKGLDLDYDIKMPKISNNPNRELKEIINKEWEKESKNIPIERHEEYLNAIRYEMDIIEKCHMEEYFILDYKIVKKTIEEYNGMLTKTGRGCFTEDALVHTKETIKSIKDVEIGDYVITESGVFNRVTNTMSYKINEELIQIKHLYGTDKYYPTICTLNHKILINRNKKIEWIQAEDIKIGDYVCVPKIKIKDDKRKIIDLNDYNYNNFDFDDTFIYERTNIQYKYSPSDVARAIGVGKSLIENYANMKKNCFSRKKEKYQELLEYIPFKTQKEYSEYVKRNQFKPIKRFIDIDETFNIFIGLMYGDGSTSASRIELAINNTTQKDAFNRNIFEKIAKSLNVDVYENKSKNKKLSQLYINSSTFTNFIKKELFISKKGKEKQFNPIWFNQSKENLLGIIEGLRQSDGSYCESRINFDNTSKSLINAYKLLCLMTNEGVNSLSIRRARIDSRGFKNKESYKLRLNKNSNYSYKRAEKTFEDKDYYYLPVKEIIRLPKQETMVYDITVENEHSYLLNNMIVHNSAVSFYINKLLGLTEIDRLKSPITLYPTRFMSVERILTTRSLPDIDLNSPSRTEFIQATKDLLGEENCGWMLSFKPLQDSSAFRLYCKSIDMEINEYDEIAKNLDDYREDKKWKDIIEKSKRFIGVIESISESPCSMLLYNKPLAEEIGFIKTKEGICINIDGYNCDIYKYLKNDYLAVKVWDIIRKTCELANISIPSINELEELLDEKTYAIYKNKLTCTINQADSKFATDLVAKYGVSSVSEMSAFVACIRPGFASLLDDFIERKPYTTGVDELDKLLEDSYHRLMYQESIMKYLIWLGIKESESYDIIKKIAKKKFKENELKELHKKLQDGWLKQQGDLKGFEETWQVVNDASKYSFNASHSLSYAYDSLYGAYLKAHYPLEYYVTTFNLYDGDTERTAKLTEELKYFGIELKSPKFRFANGGYTMDKPNNTIYKGIASIKFLNETVSEELYQLKDNQYNTFVDLLIDFENISINSRQLDILIRLNFFEEFGKRKKLLETVKIFNQIYGKKQFKKDKLPCREEIIRQFANTETDKMFKNVNVCELCKFLESTIDNEDLSVKEIIKAELEFIGSCIYMSDELEDRSLIVIDVNTKYTPKIKCYNPKTGNSEYVKISKRDFKCCPLEVGDVFIVYNVYQKNKKTKDKDGKWIDLDEFEWWIDDYFLNNE